MEGEGLAPPVARRQPTDRPPPGTGTERADAEGKGKFQLMSRYSKTGILLL